LIVPPTIVALPVEILLPLNAPVIDVAVSVVKVPDEDTVAPMVVPLIVPPVIIALPVEILLPLNAPVIDVAVTVPNAEAPTTVNVLAVTAPLALNVVVTIPDDAVIDVAVTVPNVETPTTVNVPES
jgi:hypothetical protein